MSLTSRQIDSLTKKVRELYLLEKKSIGFTRARVFIWRWGLMLYREFIRDDVKVRAESLAYLMIFSLLPLLAGLFFLFTFFTKFGMVQEALAGLTEQVLSTFPSEHRLILEEYVVKFKDAYLENMAGKSSNLGIFALVFLFWVGLQTFNNIEKTINDIWSSDKVRPFLEKVRNFLVVAVAAPIVLIAGLSIPLILKQNAHTRELLELIPFLPTLLNFIIPASMLLGMLTILYRYIPVKTVPWIPSLSAGLFAAILLQLANLGLNLYFKSGTHTPYGKAAVVPLLAFWIYVVWIIVILGAELSYLIHNRHYLVRDDKEPATLKDGETLCGILSLLNQRFQKGEELLNFNDFFKTLPTSRMSLEKSLNYLIDNKWVVENADPNQSDQNTYSLAKSLDNLEIGKTLKDFLWKDSPKRELPAQELYDKSLEHWLQFFKNNKLS